MKLSLLFIPFVFLMMTSQSWAHGVHDSGNAKPDKGGILQSLETIHLELVQIKDEVQIFVTSKDPKPKPLKTKDYPVSARAILPLGKGSEPISLTAEKHFWRAKYDAKGLHRYVFELSIKQGGHQDKVRFTIEPKKRK